MQLIDIHTHNISTNPSGAILSHSLLDGEIPQDILYVSLSIHPWYLTKDNISMQLDLLRSTIISDKRVVAVGECGIDKMCDTPLDLQIAAFYEVAKIARDNSLPLIIHAVKSSNEIIQARKRIGEDNVWIIHGFRGKAELASDYLRHGINLSFGERYNIEALKSVPLGNLFLESDESLSSFDDIAVKISSDYGLSSDILKKEASKNVSRCFPFIVNENNPIINFHR